VHNRQLADKLAHVAHTHTHSAKHIEKHEKIDQDRRSGKGWTRTKNDE
jgi:hypothetical protein